ncbi:uncharacterized protein N7446_004228 [Penicillium canescens]|uniref:uncharacterized protein n=1 Tax=Penicillium canescens TaxID=5083 RepID=UPI0026DF2C09|nr:uncharacterized protein N7446_004228 [Penicillium canescens]KAJ6067191.1 hypothetical protein N7446_004228 [Penicillium canescens]
MTYQVMCVGFASYYSMGSSYVRTREIVIGVITPQIAQHQLPTPGCLEDIGIRPGKSTDLSAELTYKMLYGRPHRPKTQVLRAHQRPNFSAILPVLGKR